jgi:NSS family neurotransmitter:Na+ symporter
MSNPNSSDEKRGQWGSKFGFIMAAAGSAVGLGNIWRFPYMTGENGGAAFVVVYLACVVFIGLPLMWAELAFGRYTGKNPVDAFRDTSSAKEVWGFKYAAPAVGFLCLAACFCVLSYYGVIAGWTIGYIYDSVAGAGMKFDEFSANPLWVIPLFAVFLVVTIYIVQAGIEQGIEKWSKILMPLLLALVGVVIIRSVTLPGAMEGIEWYLNPDFSVIDGKVVLAALGQAFFSLSVGWGLMITYGSYMPKSQNIIANGFWVALMDTGVALMGGLMVIPAVFALGFPVDSGPTLTFETLPVVFSKMPAGIFIAVLFFLLLTVAALTSSISMLEVPVSYFVDGKRASRKKAAIIVGIAAFVVGIPSALSFNGSETFSSISMSDEATVRLEGVDARNSTPEDIKNALAESKVSAGPLDYTLVELEDFTFAVPSADHNQTLAIVKKLQITKLPHATHSHTEKSGEMEFKLISVAGGKKSVDELRRALAKEDIRIPSNAVKRTPTSAVQKTRTDLTFTVALSQTNDVNQALVSSKASLGFEKLEMKTETTSFFDLMDKYFGTLCLIIISLSLSVYIGWMWDSNKIIGEIEHGYPGFTKPLIGSITPAALWIFCIRFICPIVIFVVLLGQFGVEIF